MEEEVMCTKNLGHFSEIVKKWRTAVRGSPRPRRTISAALEKLLLHIVPVSAEAGRNPFQLSLGLMNKRFFSIWLLKPHIYLLTQGYKYVDGAFNCSNLVACVQFEDLNEKAKSETRAWLNNVVIQLQGDQRKNVSSFLFRSGK